MELIMAIACDEAAVRDDGKLDIQGIFNELGAPGFPAVQEKMTVVFILEWGFAEAGTHELRADLMDRDGKKILTIQGHTDVEERRPDLPPPQTRLVLNLEQVVFPTPGSYRFQIRAGPHTVSALPLHVVERQQDPTASDRV